MLARCCRFRQRDAYVVFIYADVLMRCLFHASATATLLPSSPFLRARYAAADAAIDDADFHRSI